MTTWLGKTNAKLTPELSWNCGWPEVGGNGLLQIATIRIEGQISSYRSAVGHRLVISKPICSRSEEFGMKSGDDWAGGSKKLFQKCNCEIQSPSCRWLCFEVFAQSHQRGDNFFDRLTGKKVRRTTKISANVH